MKWRYRLRQSLVLLALIAACWLALARLSHSEEFGHSPPLGLHADVIVRDGYIGIPGVTKLYEAELTNHGLLPVSVARCEFVDDTGSSGTMIAYRVERWDRSSSSWDVVVDMNSHDFCQPAPLSIVEALLTTKWLWPGQRLTTGEEATAALDPLEKGDSARFVVYLRTADENSKWIPTEDFMIDEHPEYDAGTLP